MLQCGEYYYEHLDSEEKIEKLLDEFRNKAAQSN
jgi:hypothetical protein